MEIYEKPLANKIQLHFLLLVRAFSREVLLRDSAVIPEPSTITVRLGGCMQGVHS